jgi:hypothetical protein
VFRRVVLCERCLAEAQADPRLEVGFTVVGGTGGGT